MRVSRSLTIKQMAMVASVSMAFVLVFCTILLFHFVQQSRFTTATQLESIARSVREPLSAAILKADIPEAEAILSRIQPAGIVSRADVVLPNQFQALRMRFIPERPVPVTVTRLFELPVQISLPIYSLERPANPQPLAYLVLQADSYRMYKFVMSALATLVTAYLLLVLMLTVALTWCINRLMVRPLRRIARELNDLSQQERLGHQLTLPRLHHDDEIGMLVRSYNRNQQSLVRQHDELSIQSTRFPVSELPNKAFLLAMLEQTVARPQSAALINVTGTASFASEQLDLTIDPESKGFRVITLRSPLYVRGTFKSPQAGVKAGPLIVRGAVAAALATLVTPAAALLALISPAEGDSNQCRTILSQMKK
ncbi:TPA: HAMP domain-containing protein [Klebsiella pneumoniae]